MRVHTNPAPDIASPGIHVLSTSNDPRFPDEPVSHHLLDFKAGHLSHSRWPEGGVRDSRVVYGMDWATNAQYAASLGRGRQDRLIYLVRFHGATPEELTQEQLHEIGQTGKLPPAPGSAARHNPKHRTANRSAVVSLAHQLRKPYGSFALLVQHIAALLTPADLAARPNFDQPGVLARAVIWALLFGMPRTGATRASFLQALAARDAEAEKQFGRGPDAFQSWADTGGAVTEAAETLMRHQIPVSRNNPIRTGLPAGRLPASLRPPKPARRGLPDVPPPTRDQVEATLKSLHRDEFLAAMKRLMGQITAEEERNIYNYDEKELAKAIILAAVSGVPLETVTRGVAAKMVRQELNWVCDHAGAWLPGQKLLLDCIQRMKAELPRISSSKKAWSAERKRDVMARQEEMEEYMDTHGGWSSDPKSRHYRWTPE